MQWKMIIYERIGKRRIKHRGLFQVAVLFLGAFAKLWKATISFVMTVCLSVCMDQLGSHWTDFHEIWYLFFENLWEKIEVSLKNLRRITGTLSEELCIFMIVSLLSLLRMRHVSDRSSRENQNRHFMFNSCLTKIVPFMRYVEKYDTATQTTGDNTRIILWMHFACRMTKSRIQTHTHNI